ncbi:hypothetical protein BJX63DRAFT_417767 [Aspergillus granulosus]|uniref:Uncharacterized protein n=1 Tax=Aspergillus granulosus TaxID=176169 RepID=A0ABR4I3T1_9EURO
MTDQFEWYLPEWGQLPAEQYLIRFGDSASPESAGEQRSRLIQQFLQLDEIDPEWDPTSSGTFPERKPSHIPTPEEMVTVLRPWRSDDLLLGLLVRTYCDSPDDKRAETWETMSEEYESCAYWSFLNGKGLFNPGTDWHLLFNILPEIGGFFKNYPCRPTAKDLAAYCQDFKEVLPAVKRGNRQTDNFNAVLMLHFLLVYLDSKLNTVMQGRIDINEVRLSQPLVDWEMAKFPIGVFEETTLGEKYLYDGEIGRELYQWTREDLEDDPPTEEMPHLNV